MKKILPVLLCMSAGISLTWAQSVNWNHPGPLAPNETGQLELVFTDCQPSGGVNFPQVNGLQVLGQPGRATSFSMINFQTSSSTTLSFAILPTQAGRIQIPPFEVATDKGKKTVPGLALDVAAASSSSRRPPPAPQPNFPFPPGFFQNTPPPAAPQGSSAGSVQSTATAEPNHPYAGEVFDVNYRVFITGNRSGRVKTTPLWDVQNFSAEAWDRGQQIGPGGSQGLQFHTRAMVPKAGPFDLPPISQKLDLDTSLGGRSFFFTAPGSEEVEVSTDAVGLQIQALPGGAPAGFKGAVGQFTLESKMVPEQVNEGEPVTWTLILKGTGNWPMGVELPARAIPNQIRTIQPKLRKEFNGTEIFTGAVVEDLVMIPAQSGEYELPAVKFVYFDPKKKSYETAEAKPPKITVTKGAVGLSLATPAPVSASSSVGPKEKSPAPNSNPTKPLQYGAPGLPREPVAGSSWGFAPVGWGWVLAITLLPWAFVLRLWWKWIQERSALRDPLNQRRDALKQWQACVGDIEKAKKIDDIVRPLILWQQAVFKVLGIHTAAPVAGEIIRAKTHLVSEDDRKNLYEAYQTVVDALYGKDTGVKIGVWCDRVKGIAGRIQFPPMGLKEILRPKNIWPWLGLWILCLGPCGICAEPSGQPSPAAQADPIAQYRSGAFDEARKIWEEKARKNRYDPVAQNNLALCWYQLGDQERALAHVLSAYLRQPSLEGVAWNMKIFTTASSSLDPEVRRLFDEGWTARLTSWCGVFGWQMVVVLGSALMAGGGVLGLASGYFKPFKALRLRLGVLAILMGTILMGAAGMALDVYGKLSDRAAVMIVDVEPLRSVPTEVEPQAEKAYPPGSIAHREKEFLGWSKIRMPNQDVGWIRTEHVVPLY